jgi:hypothetical protein
MRVTVHHRGVPVGTVILRLGGPLAMGDVEPLPGYAALQPTLRAGGRVEANLGYLPPEGHAVGGVDAAGEAAGRAALARVDALSRELELRDARGALVPTAWVELTDVPGGRGVWLVAELTIAPAGAPAALHEPPLSDADAAPPAA